MALPATDTFTTGADAALTTYSANWSMNTGAIQVLAASDDFHGNTATAHSTGFHNVETYNNDQYSQIVVNAISSGNFIGCAVRCGAASVNSFYYWQEDNTSSYLGKLVAGTDTQLGSTGGAGAVSDTLRLEAESTTIRPKRNGSVPGTPGAQTDSSLTSGKAGINGWNNSSTCRGDNFEGGNLATATLEQEGFAFGDDDGNEASHTLSTQDTNITTAAGTTKTLRTLVNATLDPASLAYTLRYQKNGSGGYTAVPVGASITTSPPTAPTATGTTIGAASGTWAINRSTASSGDVVVFVIAWDDSTNVTSVTAPAGVNSESAVSIAGPVASASTEMRMQAWYYVATGTWGAGTLTFTPAASETCRAVSFTIPSGQFNASDIIGFSGTTASAGTAESNVNSPTGTAESDDGSGRLYIAFGSDADALTAPGSNWNTINNTTGGGVGLLVGTRDTTVSNSESIAALTATIASDSWASLCFVVKPNVANNDIYVTTSANITAGGEATTARLSAPSGKTTGDFVTGRRWDDENGSDSTDITTDDYSEFEWCLAVRSGLSNGDYFDLRTYAGSNALDTYTFTPRWTIDTGTVAAHLFTLLGVGG